nr:hypothetical protein [uncultured bacterium]
MSFSEDDCTEYQESAALVDCSAVYRAVLLTLSRVAASRTLSPCQASAFYYGDPLGEMRLVSRVFEM